LWAVEVAAELTAQQQHQVGPVDQMAVALVVVPGANHSQVVVVAVVDGAALSVMVHTLQ
jgi:hypothetical protein